MTSRDRLLAGVIVAAGVLLLGGAILFMVGIGGDHDLGRVLGILAVVLGLVLLRILFWVRRARLLSDVGRGLHVSPPQRGSQNDRSE